MPCAVRRAIGQRLAVGHHHLEVLALLDVQVAQRVSGFKDVVLIEEPSNLNGLGVDRVAAVIRKRGLGRKDAVINDEVAEVVRRNPCDLIGGHVDLMFTNGAIKEDPVRCGIRHVCQLNHDRRNQA